MSDAIGLRKNEDLAKLRAFQHRFPKIVQVASATGAPPSVIEVVLCLPTPEDNHFPARWAKSTRVRINLPERYPFEPPRVSVLTKVFNPHVYTSGNVCLGAQWTPTENLELLVRRIMKILALDPGVINVKSPANGEAAQWYDQKRRAEPDLFPTFQVDSLGEAPPPPTLVWRNIR